MLLPAAVKRTGGRDDERRHEKELSVGVLTTGDNSLLPPPYRVEVGFQLPLGESPPVLHDFLMISLGIDVTTM